MWHSPLDHPRALHGRAGRAVALGLFRLGRAHAVAEFTAPADLPLERGVARRRCRPHPSTREHVVALAQFGLRVDGVLAVRERELEELRFGDRFGRARLDAHVAVDAAQVVDLVDEAEALARRRGILGIVVGTADVDAVGRADTGAQLAPDALLHAVLVAVEHMASVQPLGSRELLVVLDVAGRVALALRAPATRVLGGDPIAAEQAVLADRDGKSLEVAHQFVAPARLAASRLARLTRSAAANSPMHKPATTRLISTTRMLSCQSPSDENSRSAASSRNHPSEIGMSTFQPKSISWS